jgi:hypothetical protein
LGNKSVNSLITLFNVLLKQFQTICHYVGLSDTT